jgi:hypothetical protein
VPASSVAERCSRLLTAYTVVLRLGDVLCLLAYIPGRPCLVQVSRTVQQMRDFEATLLKAFRAYIKLLQNIAGPADVGLSHRRCAEALIALPKTAFPTS